MAINRQKFSISDKIKYLISNPNVFFERIKYENSIKDAFLIDAIIRALIVALLYFLIFSIILVIEGDSSIYNSYNFIISLIIFSLFFIGVIKNFLLSGIIYLILKMYKIKRAYHKTYNVYVYSSIPFLILGLIPYIGLFSIIYSYYLMIIGMAKVHNISIGKSALACLLPILILILVFVLPFLWFIFYFNKELLFAANS